MLRRLPVLLFLFLLLGASGCMVGPSYVRPAAPVAARWRSADDRLRATTDADPARWWRCFGDAALDALVDAAYAANPDLEAAGLRVVQAQARRAIAIGSIFPQTQAVRAAYTRGQASLETRVPPPARGFETFEAGFDAAWEVDVWGRFRRGIEAADASVLAALADYDDVLVSLVGEVARVYVQLRVVEARLALAGDNVRVERDSLEIARVRWQAGGTSELDVEQATTLLADTEAAIPALEIARRQSEDALSVLLGVPPADLADVLGRSAGIPAPPATVAIGVPTDLLRRRPDVRRAERQLAAQSARIGVADADLLPRFQLVGSIGLSADDAAKFAEGRAFEAMGGPRIDWPILNYGRLVNAVRVEDAAFQELVARYASTVLRAQQDVEDALVGYLRGTARVAALERSVAAANHAVDLALIQYREGAADYTRVLTAQQAKLQEEDRLTTSRGDVTQATIALYKAVGGGWELGADRDVVPERAKREMRERTWWGGLLEASARTDDEAAAHARAGSSAEPRPWWRPW